MSNPLNPADLFPPAPDRSASLNDEEFRAAFDRYWRSLETRFFKFERLQTYQEAGNASLQAFLEGRRSEAMELLGDYRHGDAEYYEAACRKDVHVVRVRAVEQPLSPYLQWEFASYHVSARYGERILVIDLTEESAAEASAASDFLLFDTRVALVLNYGAGGLLRGAWLLDSPQHVQPYAELAARLIRAAVPLAVFERRQNPQ